MRRLPKEETAISAPMWALTSLCFGGGVEARDAVEAVAVGQCHGGHVDFECAFDVGLGGGRPDSRKLKALEAWSSM